MQARLTITADVGGVNMLSTATRNGEAHAAFDKTLDPAKEGDLTTRTSDTAGELTMDSGHGFATSDIIDLYWDGGQRYNVDVGTVAGDAVPITGGSGDNLPVQDTAIVAMVQVVVNHADFEGDMLQAIAIHSANRGHIGLYGSGDTEHLPLDMVAGELWSWLSGGSEANPIAGDTIIEARVTHDSSSGTCVQKMGAVLDTA